MNVSCYTKYEVLSFYNGKNTEIQVRFEAATAARRFKLLLEGEQLEPEIP